MREGHAPAPDLRPEDMPVSPVSLRRVGALFGPYRARLSGLLSLIFLSAGLGVISPFLLREFINKAYPQHDTKLVIELVSGMIALSIITSVIGVAQTWISNQVGQRVMHDLRAAVYAHLHRRGAVAHRKRHRRRRQRRDVDRDLDRPERDDRRRRGRGDVPARLAP